MVQVVGRDQQAVKRVTCHKCASVLKYTKNETFKTTINHDYLGDYDTVNAVRCPTCGNNQQVK